MAEPSVAYHYCSSDVFLSIITQKKIWFSDCKKFNDHKEIEWFYDSLLLELAPILEEYDGSPKLESFKSSLEQQKNADILMCCFSKQGDLLSQWAKYASNGAGVSIGFNLDALYKELQKKIDVLSDKTGFHAMTLKKVVSYDDDKLKKIVKSIANDFKKRLENDDDSHLQRYGRLFQVSSEIEEHRCTFKNPAFSEENEVRLCVISRYIPYIGEKYFQFRSSGHDMVKYYELDFSKISSPINKIILGPKCPISDKDIALLLQTHNLGRNIEIVPSLATYR